jgi:hypothetical protein
MEALKMSLKGKAMIIATIINIIMDTFITGTIVSWIEYLNL